MNIVEINRGVFTMNRAQIVFKAIDGICYPTQNMMKFSNVVCEKDISYDTAELTKGDLYYRKDIVNDGKKHPLILYYHGGGFIMGDKKCRVSISEFYANQGYFVFCVNYRMPPERIFPEYTFDFFFIIITDCISVTYGTHSICHACKICHSLY